MRAKKAQEVSQWPGLGSLLLLSLSPFSFARTGRQANFWNMESLNIKSADWAWLLYGKVAKHNTRISQFSSIIHLASMSVAASAKAWSAFNSFEVLVDFNFYCCLLTMFVLSCLKNGSMMSDIISFYICSRDCQCKADNPAPYANLLNQQGTARRHSLCSWSEVPLTSTNQAAKAASLPKLKTHRSTPSHRAITQLDCYITAKVPTCTVDMHKVVTQFVPIAAVKTVEVLTSDLKKQTSLKMETYFQAFKLSTDALVIF